MWCCPVVEVGLKTKHKILIAPTKASVKCVTAYIRLWLVILWLWCVMLLIWLLLRSLVGYCCACGLLMWLCCCAIGDIHSGVKSGCKLVTLLSFLWYDKLWGPSQRVVTLFFVFLRRTVYLSDISGDGGRCDRETTCWRCHPQCGCPGIEVHIG